MVLGLNSQQMFKSEGDRKVIQQLVSLFNQGISLAFLGRQLTMGNFDLGLTFVIYLS